MYNNLKYKVQEILDKMPAIERDLAMSAIPESIGITRQTFFKIRTCRKDDNYSPNGDTLIAISEYFGISANDLMYYRTRSIALPQTVEI